MLTATPILNRLWDLYSLVDCLTVAKGHDNLLGSPSQFVQRFVADGKQSGRSAPWRKNFSVPVLDQRTATVDEMLFLENQSVGATVRRS
jgi:hypothetical protein